MFNIKHKMPNIDEKENAFKYILYYKVFQSSVAELILLLIPN